eukprot:262113-Chlamydomonas_euryale.AAC.1
MNASTYQTCLPRRAQAVLRAVLGYFTNAPLDTIPTLQIPLHTIVELRPRPDGTMEVEQLPVALSGHWQESAAPSHLPPPALPVQVRLNPKPFFQAVVRPHAALVTFARGKFGVFEASCPGRRE